MKKVLLFTIAFLLAGSWMLGYGQVDVTFRVDMANQTVNPAGVSVAGNFQDETGVPGDWTPGATVLTQVGVTTVYAVTVTLPVGVYEFKYINGNSWGQDESVPAGCAVNGNRQVIVNGGPIVLDAVCFGSCTSCNPPNVSVTFQVNMAEQTVSPLGVHIAGSFQGWNPGATALTLDHDAVYSFTTDLPVGGYFEYKFVNGDNWGMDESVPGGCNQNGNRFISVPASATTLDPVCFASCVNCAVPPVDVTFQVDMSEQVVSPAGVHIAGSFQGWDPAATALTLAGSNIYTVTLSLTSGDFFEYKFVNGNSWGTDETVPAECSNGWNRTITVPAANTILNPVCFASCTGCPGGASDLLFSEYGEGSSNNKWLEVYNGTGSAVDLTPYSVKLGANGNAWTTTLALTGTLADGDVFVIANSAANATILAAADVTSTVTFYNGDDALGLFKDNVLIDVFGTYLSDPGTSWPVAGITGATVDHTLIRKEAICSPTTDWALSAGTDLNNSQWVVNVNNYVTNIGMHTAVCGGSPVVALPTFSAPAGLYLSAINLQLNCTTPGSTIFYTTDGTDPSNLSTQYTGPISVGATTTIKAIAYAVGYSSSNIAQAIYAFPIDVSNIAELRAGSPNVPYRLTGETIMTFKQTFRNQKYIQDNTAAILIDDLAIKITTNYNIGDGITGIIGVVAEFGNMLQFTPSFDPGAATSTGNVITPKVITLNEMVTNFEAYESELVEIKNVQFNGGGANFANGLVYGMTDGSKATASFRTTFYDVNYIGTPVPVLEANVAGICNARAEGNFLTSRNLADITVLQPTITILSPNGGEEIEQGTSFEITWYSASVTGNVKIAVHTPFIKGGILLGNVPVLDHSFTWNVTETPGEYIIVIQSVADTTIYDLSDATFDLVYPIDIKISEIMYNSPEAGTDTLEFIEFYNNGAGIVNLENWKLTKGVVFTFPNVTINPAAYLVLAYNSGAFLNTFGQNVLQWASGSLSNNGEEIQLNDDFGGVRAYVNFDDVTPWPVQPDGQGPSLTFCNTALVNSDPANWSASTNLSAVNADGNGIYCTPGTGCNTNDVLVMNYPQGWMGISSNLDPGKTSMETLFAAAYGKMTILLGEDGIFWPGQNLNTIGDWDTHQGYKAKFNNNAYFVYTGTPVVDQTVTFTAGIHYLPVLSLDTAWVSNVLVPLGNAIEFAFDITNGGIYWPSGGFIPGTSGALEALCPGYAYLLKVNNNVTIDLNPTDASTNFAVNPISQFINTTTWNQVTRTGEQHIISVTGTQNLETGDVIGVFDVSGICTGMATFEGNSPIPLVVYGEDITTTAKDGMNEQEPLTFKVYRQGVGFDATAIYDENTVNHDGLFASNGLSIVKDLKLGTTGINADNTATYSIFPNPSNGQFTISVDGKREITINNAAGQVVYSKMANGSTTIDLSAQPKGVYFIKLAGESSVSFDKIVIR